MLKNIEETLNKSCLIGLSYFTAQGEQLKQNILAGRVIKVDSEMGITVELFTKDNSQGAHFILPIDLSCWFIAPKGDFHTNQTSIKITNPDYLITWDIYQTKDQGRESATKVPQNSEQQWWQWQPRTQPPNIG